ncbi:MAG TPA: methylmalonyl-CoA mutase family protein [Streptomyces sp.]
MTEPRPRPDGDRVAGTAAEWNARHHRPARRRVTELSVAFDLPTRRGQDSDTPAASGEVGVAGVAVDSIDDMRVLFRGIPLDKVRTTLTVDAPAAVLLLLYELVAEEQGVPPDRLRGAVRGDVLTAHITRGTRIFPLRPSLRFVADTFAYCRAVIPKWTVVSLRGDDLAAMGASPAQEIAFTLASGIEYLRTAVAAGTHPQDAASRVAFPAGRRTADVTRRLWTRTIHKGRPAPWRGRTAPVPGEWVRDALALMDRVEELGGAAAAVEQGFQTREIAPAARHRPRRQHPANPLAEAQQTERIAKLRAWRVEPALTDALARLRRAAEGSDNVLYPLKEALRARATVGEVCGVLSEVWGHDPGHRAAGASLPVGGT